MCKIFHNPPGEDDQFEAVVTTLAMVTGHLNHHPTFPDEAKKAAARFCAHGCFRWALFYATFTALNPLAVVMTIVLFSASVTAS